MESGQRLRLILTNPQEFAVSVKGNWTLTAELKTAIAGGKAVVLFADPEGQRLLDSIHG